MQGCSTLLITMHAGQWSPNPKPHPYLQALLLRIVALLQRDALLRCMERVQPMSPLATTLNPHIVP